MHGVPRDAQGKFILPLTLREHIGSAGYTCTPIVDEKLTERDGYKYSGNAGTRTTWNGKAERRSISRAPVTMNISKLAGEQGLGKIAESSPEQAASAKPAEGQQIINNG